MNNQTLLQDPDDLDFCETCLKKGCEVTEMGHRWCCQCWEAFKVEYNTWLDSSKETSNGK